MIENLTYRVETSAETREKAAQALGFDEPPVGQKLSRSDFNSDEEYFHACAELAVRKHQEEIAQAIKDYVLRPEEQARVDDEARSRAQADLAAGKISFQQLGASVAQYAEKLTRDAKEEKVHTADLNRQIREAMAKVRRGHA